MNTILKNFKHKLENDQGVIGPFMKTSDPAFVESAGFGGFNFAILDMEHGPVSVETMQNLIRAAVISNLVPIVRVPDCSEESIGKALDIGALGIQVPQVSNAKQAKEVIKSAKFHPEGERGVCRFVRAANYSAMDRYEYFKNANDALIILQLEGQEAINNIDEILAVKGIDILFIGPYDLSQSLGFPGDIMNPVVVEKMQYIVKKAREMGIFVGTFVDELEHVNKWCEAGVQYFAYSVDVGIFYEGCKSIINSTKFVK